MNEVIIGSATNKAKYIFITGGVISGVGKGITTSFIGAVLKSYGYPVTAIKIDPYINIDAGTFSPYEHGEVYVLDDGSEVDLDLGNYERLLDIRLSSENNITTGKIYHSVITKERQGKYLGRTVQIIPHITDEIQRVFFEVGNRSTSPVEGFSKICLIEVGGTVGDIESMPFLEAIRQFQIRIGRDNFCNIHVSLLPLTVEGEIKTKPTQMSVRQMNSQGLQADFIFCRSERELLIEDKNKISLFCDVAIDNIVSMPNLQNIFLIFPKLCNQNIVEKICDKLELPKLMMTPMIDLWLNFSQKCSNLKSKLTIALVGKYVSLKDAYHSIKAALHHAGVYFDYNVKINWVNSEYLDDCHKVLHPPKYSDAWNLLKQSQGVVMPGGFDKRGFDGMISAANYCRVNKVPFLGICLGFQVMIVEYARNILYLSDANSTEIFPEATHPVVIDMPEFNPTHKGASMRLGLKKTVFTQTDSQAYKLYHSKSYIFERHRHRFEFNTIYKEMFEKNGFHFVGNDETATRMEIGEIKENFHPFYLGVQYHPEFLSRPLSPSPLFLGLVQRSIEYANLKTEK